MFKILNMSTTTFVVALFVVGASAQAQNIRLDREKNLETILNKASSELAPSFQKEWHQILNNEYKFKINLDAKNQRLDQCLQIQRRKQNDSRSAIKNLIPYYQITSNKTCLASKSVDWAVELHREVTEWWFKNLNVKFRSQLISLVYAQNFFSLNTGYPLNIETDLETMVANFFALGGQALLQNRADFEKTHKDAAKLIDAVVFDQVRDINQVSQITYEGSSKIYPLQAKVKMIDKSNEAWFIRYHMLKNAKKSIRIQSYSLFDDLYGRATVALLLEAVKRGVDVKVSLDGRGSIMTSRSDLVELLVHRGAQVSSYNPLFWSALNLQKFFYAGPISGIMSSNHDKIIIVDDYKILTGGRNLGNRYFVMPGEDPGKIYQDMDVYAECETQPFSAVVAFNIEFYSANAINVTPIFTRIKKFEEVISALRTLEAKMFGTQVLSDDQVKYPEINRFKSVAAYSSFDPTPNPELHLIEGLDKTSILLGKNALTDEIFKNFDLAQESITIINPYVILSTGARARLIAAGQRGVKITIVTTSPTSTDSKLTQARLIGEWRGLLTDIPNLRLFGATGPTKLHAKSFVFDSKIAIVGSYNLDLLSQEINSEFALKIVSEEFAAELKGFIDDYALNQSLEYDVAKNIGPHSQPNGQKKFKSMNRLRFLSRIVRPIL